jgi:UDP-N-acetylmuramyl pentapeptide phosphotransferase/UDP-N-acetylglucosamine-1-phosphate transferase
LFIGWWFYYKIQFDHIVIPWFTGDKIGLIKLVVGAWIVPIITLVLLALYGSSTIDGFDGLATGCLIPIFLCYGGIAFTQQKFELATLIMVIVGAMVAYLW